MDRRTDGHSDTKIGPGTPGSYKNAVFSEFLKPFNCSRFILFIEAGHIIMVKSSSAISPSEKFSHLLRQSVHLLRSNKLVVLLVVLASNNLCQAASSQGWSSSPLPLFPLSTSPTWGTSNIFVEYYCWQMLRWYCTGFKSSWRDSAWRMELMLALVEGNTCGLCRWKWTVYNDRFSVKGRAFMNVFAGVARTCWHSSRWPGCTEASSSTSTWRAGCSCWCTRSKTGSVRTMSSTSSTPSMQSLTSPYWFVSDLT